MLPGRADRESEKRKKKAPPPPPHACLSQCVRVEDFMGQMNRVLVEFHRAKKCKPPKEIRGVKMIRYYGVQEYGQSAGIFDEDSEDDGESEDDYDEW
jgi:hypothetical protein